MMEYNNVKNTQKWLFYVDWKISLSFHLYEIEQENNEEGKLKVENKMKNEKNTGFSQLFAFFIWEFSLSLTDLLRRQSS